MMPAIFHSLQESKIVIKLMMMQNFMLHDAGQDLDIVLEH